MSRVRIPPEAAHFFSREKRELSLGVVVYFALSLWMSLHVCLKMAILFHEEWTASATYCIMCRLLHQLSYRGSSSAWQLWKCKSVSPYKTGSLIIKAHVQYMFMLQSKRSLLVEWWAVWESGSEPALIIRYIPGMIVWYGLVYALHTMYMDS